MAPINPLKLLQIKNAWDQFTNRHPKLPAFLRAVSTSAIGEGTILEMTVITADGKKYNTNLKISAEDMQMINELKNIAGDMR